MTTTVKQFPHPGKSDPRDDPELAHLKTRTRMVLDSILADSLTDDGIGYIQDVVDPLLTIAWCRYGIVQTASDRPATVIGIREPEDRG